MARKEALELLLENGRWWLTICKPTSELYRKIEKDVQHLETRLAAMENQVSSN